MFLIFISKKSTQAKTNEKHIFPRWSQISLIVYFVMSCLCLVSHAEGRERLVCISEMVRSAIYFANMQKQLNE